MVDCDINELLQEYYLWYKSYTKKIKNWNDEKKKLDKIKGKANIKRKNKR